MDAKKIVKLIFMIFLGIGVLLLIVLLAGLWARIDDSGVFALVLGIMSAVWLAIGGVGLFVIQIKERRRASLLAGGRRISARITGVMRDYMLQVNGRNPWRIQCQYTDEGERVIYTFRSEPIWFDPSEFLAERKAIDVCVDGYNYSRYVVDVRDVADGYVVKSL